MADELYLDIDAFSGLISTLDTAAEDMTSANNRLADTDGSDLGSTPLDNAAENFRNKWKYGIEKIADATEKMEDGLELTRDLYAEQERVNAGSLDAVGAALPEPRRLVPRAELEKMVQDFTLTVTRRPAVDLVNHPAAAMFRGRGTVFTPTLTGVPLTDLNRIANHHGYYYLGDRPSRWSTSRVERICEVRCATPATGPPTRTPMGIRSLTIGGVSRVVRRIPATTPFAPPHV